MTEDDSELLRRYAEERSEKAFATLVRRHLDLVYSVALRQVGGDAHLAQDVAQTVFTSLARKAASLAARPVLGGWLYRTTQFTAIDVVRSESRRRAREQEAQTMQDFSVNPNPGGAVDWDKLRSTLDQAIGELNDPDRDAVVLRFFEGKSFADVGAKLRLTENSARMRVERALDKLHALLARRGVTSTTAALAVALANQPAMAAPVGLAGIVTGTALAGAGAGAGWLGTSMITSKLVLGIVGASAAVAVAVSVAQKSDPVSTGSGATSSRIHAAAAADQPTQAALQTKVKELESQVAAERQRATAADEDNGKMLAAIQTKRAGGDAADAGAAGPITHELVEARYKHAQDLARDGRAEEALGEFLWCFDIGMPSVPGYSGVRASFLLSSIVKLGENYPVALEALRERRDRALQRMLAGATDFEATMDFASINRILKEDDKTIAALDQLPADDSRRRTLAGAAYQQLILAQRYPDALIGRSYNSMSSQFELHQQERPMPANLRDPDRVRKMEHDLTVNSTSADIEVLAGAGDLEHARALAARLLAFDGSDKTKSLLQQHLARAGHPELLANKPKS